MNLSKLTSLIAAASFILSVLSVMAQIDESKPFVYLQNGNVVYSNSIRVSQGLFKEKLVIDKKKYEMNEIKFINEGNGFYANTLGVYGKKKSAFAERTVKGPINVFEMVEVSVTSTPRGGTSTTRRNLYFINSAYNNLSYMRPKNLEPLVKNNEQSMIHLNNSKRYYKKTIILGSVALASFLTGLTSFAIGLATVEDDAFGSFSIKPVPTFIIPAIGIAVGFGTGIACNKSNKKMEKEMLKSIDVFNSAEVKN